MTQFNTNLPTQLVVGWTQTDAITDAQIDALLRQITPHLFDGGLTKNVVFLRITAYRKAVREWMTNL